MGGRRRSGDGNLKKALEAFLGHRRSRGDETAGCGREKKN